MMRGAQAIVVTKVYLQLPFFPRRPTVMKNRPSLLPTTLPHFHLGYKQGSVKPMPRSHLLLASFLDMLQSYESDVLRRCMQAIVTCLDKQQSHSAAENRTKMIAETESVPDFRLPTHTGFAACFKRESFLVLTVLLHCFLSLLYTVDHIGARIAGLQAFSSRFYAWPLFFFSFRTRDHTRMTSKKFASSFSEPAFPTIPFQRTNSISPLSVCGFAPFWPVDPEPLLRRLNAALPHTHSPPALCGHEF